MMSLGLDNTATHILLMYLLTLKLVIDVFSCQVSE